MTIEFTVLSDLTLVVSVVYGGITDADLRQHFELLRADEAFMPEFDLLSDCRYITENLVTHKTIQEETMNSPYLPTARRAMLVERALERARGHQYGLYSSATEDHFLLTDDTATAIRWLGHEAHAERIMNYINLFKI
jgi:hypothetical protein